MFFPLVRLLVIVHLVSNGISDVTAIECYQCSDVDAGNSSDIPQEKMDRNCRNPDINTLTCNNTQSCFTIFAIYDYKNDTAREITRGCGEGSLENLKFETGHMKKYKIEKCVLAKCNVINVTDTIIDEKFHQEKKLNVEKGKNYTLQDQGRRNARSGVQWYDCMAALGADCLDPGANQQSSQIKLCTSSGTECGTSYFSGKIYGEEIYTLRRGCKLDSCKDVFSIFPIQSAISGRQFPPGFDPDKLPDDLFPGGKPPGQENHKDMFLKSMENYKCLDEICTGNLCNSNPITQEQIKQNAEKGETYTPRGEIIGADKGGADTGDGEHFVSSSIKILPKLEIFILNILLLLFLLT